MKTAKKTAILMVALCMLLTLSVGCSGSSNTDSGGAQPSAEQPPADNGNSDSVSSDASVGGTEQITLDWGTIFVPSDPRTPSAEAAVAAFEAEYPHIKINWIRSSNAEYESTKLKADAAADVLPDVFFSWFMGFSKDFVDAGRVLPLDDYLNDGTLDRLAAGALDAATYDGKVYGIPSFCDMGMMYVNTALFEECGVKVPANTDEWLDAVNKFNAAGVTPMVVGGRETWTIAMIFDAMMLNAVGQDALMKALTRETDFSNPGFLLAAEAFEALVKAGAFSDSSPALDYDEANAEFYLGKAAMYGMGSWVNADMEDSGNPVSANVDIVPIPQVVGGTGKVTDYTVGINEGWMVSSKTKYPEEAVLFAKFFAERHAQEAVLLNETSTVVWDVPGSDGIELSPLSKKTLDYLDIATGFVPAADGAMTGEDADYYLMGLSRLFLGDLTAQGFIEYLNQMP